MYERCGPFTDSDRLCVVEGVVPRVIGQSGQRGFGRDLCSKPQFNRVTTTICVCVVQSTAMGGLPAPRRPELPGCHGDQSYQCTATIQNEV